MAKLTGIAILVFSFFIISNNVQASSNPKKEVDSLFNIVNQLKNDTAGTQAFENLFNASLLSLKSNLRAILKVRAGN